jgi:hypothetical protein
MKTYKFLKKKAFENMESFEKRLNEQATQGQTVVSFTQDHGGIIVLLERER